MLKAPRAGVIVSVDEELRRDATAKGERVVEVVPAFGDFIPEGAPIPSRGPPDERIVLGALGGASGDPPLRVSFRPALRTLAVEVDP